MIRALLIGLCLLLGACAARTPLPLAPAQLVTPLPLSLHIRREQAGQQQDWLLVLQREDAALRWSLFDPLGVPLARQQLSAGEWRNDGLLPPNDEARELFAALLFALTPGDDLARSYPADTWRLAADGQRRLNPAWQLGYRAALNFTLKTTRGLSYRVSALAAEEGS
jgi:hypothetical protein